MKLLGIETSCDETAAAIVTDEREILSNVVWSQLEAHQPYGGVVPEIASRAHNDAMEPVIKQALEVANTDLAEIDAIAVTAGPGLIGGVIVGVMVAKGMAYALNKPIIPVNHLEGHALTARLTDDVAFPYLLLLVSGGHCQILHVKALGEYTLLGTTQDDALGEAFDKTAKLLGLGYPGGPAVEKLAREGDAERFDLPRPLCKTTHCDFSFSGLKTAVRRAAENLPQPITRQDKADICASFQEAAKDILINRLSNALKQNNISNMPLVVAGGVAANQFLNAHLRSFAEANSMTFTAPPIKLCTDNAAMIAWAGLEHHQAGQRYNMSFKPRARWALGEV